MKIKKNLKLITFVVCIAIIPFSVGAATPKWIIYHVLNVWSVDSGKHMDWSGTTSYQSNFNTAVNTWNNYKNGVIRKDTLFTENDVTISDGSDISGNTVAITAQRHFGSGGKSIETTIKFSTAKMNNLSNTKKTIVCTHELGHTLGLNENNDYGTDVIMYDNIDANTSNNILHREDKMNYDYMYNNKY